MPILIYPFAKLRFRTLRQALTCTAPFILLGQSIYLGTIITPDLEKWLTDVGLTEFVGLSFLASIAWLFIAAAITNKALARDRNVAFGIRIRSAPSQPDQTARKIVLVVTGAVFLSVYAYVAARQDGSIGSHIALGMLFATASAMLAFYDAALIVWVLSGLRICPEGRAKPNPRTEMQRTAAKSR